MTSPTQRLIVKTQYYTFAQPPDDLVLDSGKHLGPVTVAYEVYGTLNPARSNAVLVCHGLSGDAHAAGWHEEPDDQPGWWDEMIGPGKAIDTDKFFVIATNSLGGCKGTTGPVSIDPKTNKKYGLSFPVVSIGDMVQVQRRLVDYFGIKTLHAVIGGSMGGMQVLEWAIQYPERVRYAIPIATTSKLSPLSIALDAVGREAIMTDEKWQNGQYHEAGKIPSEGLAIARMIGHITYLSDESMRRKFGRRLQTRATYGYDFTKEFEVESYLQHQGDKFVKRFDANSYLYLTKAMDYFDLEGKYGSLEHAFEKVQAKFLVISFTSDWLFPVYQSKEIIKALIKNGKDVSYCNVDSHCGHDAFLLEFDHLGRLVKGFIGEPHPGS